MDDVLAKAEEWRAAGEDVVIVYGERESDESLAVREHGGGQSTKSLDALLTEFAALDAKV